MAEPMSGDPDADDRFVRLDDGDMNVVADGKPGAPALLLIHGTVGSTAWWDPVVRDGHQQLRTGQWSQGASHKGLISIAAVRASGCSPASRTAASRVAHSTTS
jgi:pimeloyl-ACP methyl ester carboxylesterase